MAIEIEPPDVTALNETSNLRVSIIYEDFESGVRAKNCLDRLAHNLNSDGEAFSIRLWSFDYLSDPAMRNLAAKEASDFEIIFLSTRGGGEPPAAIKEWMAEWLKHRDSRPCALAVMPDEQGQTHPGGTALLRYLTRVAQSGGLDLVHPFGERVEQPNHDAVRQIVRRAINASPLLEGIVDEWQSFAHWGINE